MLADYKRRFVKKLMQQLQSQIISTQENELDTILNIKKQDLVEVCRFIYEEKNARLFTCLLYTS